MEYQNNIFLLLIAVSISTLLQAQNLVKNHSFDENVYIEHGIYTTLPSSVAHWNGYTYFQRNGKTSTYDFFAPIYSKSNRYITQQYSVNGDSAFVLFCPFKLYGSFNYLCGELTYQTQKDVEYELSFDYELINDSKIALKYIYCALTTQYGYAGQYEDLWCFSYYNPLVIDLVKIDLQNNVKERQHAVVHFKSKGGAGFIIMGYIPDIKEVSNRIDSIWLRQNKQITIEDIQNMDFCMPIELLVNNNEQRISKNDIQNYNANYVIDNICITALDKTILHNDKVQMKHPTPNVDYEIEYNIKEQIHQFYIDNQTYVFERFNGNLIETDSMEFDNVRFMQNFRDEKQFYVDDEHTNSVKRPDYEDNIWHIIASRTLTKYFGEPYWNANREYFRMCYFRADNPIVFNIFKQDNRLKLNVKIGNGSYVWHGDLTTDTIIDLPQKTANLIRKAIDLEEFDCLQHSLYNVGGPSVLYVDYHIGKHSNMFMIGDEYFWHEKIKKTEYKNVYKLLKMLVEISDEKIK